MPASVLTNALETTKQSMLQLIRPIDSEWPDYAMLSQAIDYCRKDIVDFLLINDCRVTIPSITNTFIHKALYYLDWTDIIKKLIDFGASVSSIDDNGDTAVHVAFKNNVDGDLMDLLLSAYVRETDENIVDLDGLSILHIACSRSNLKIVRSIKYKWKDINAQARSSGYDNDYYSGYTPLHFAVRHGHLNIAIYLLKHRANVYKFDANLSTPLHLALELGNIEMLDYLLMHDAKYSDLVNANGLSHFMAACAGNDATIVCKYIDHVDIHNPLHKPSYLIDKIVNEGLYRGYTALHFAAKFGQLDAVELLLADGASCFVKTADDLTPLIVALKNGHEDICRVLLAAYRFYRQMLFCNNDERDISDDWTEVDGESDDEYELSDESEIHEDIVFVDACEREND